MNHIIGIIVLLSALYQSSVIASPLKSIDLPQCILTPTDDKINVDIDKSRKHFNTTLTPNGTEIFNDCSYKTRINYGKIILNNQEYELKRGRRKTNEDCGFELFRDYDDSVHYISFKDNVTVSVSTDNRLSMHSNISNDECYLDNYQDYIGYLRSAKEIIEKFYNDSSLAPYGLNATPPSLLVNLAFDLFVKKMKKKDVICTTLMNIIIEMPCLESKFYSKSVLVNNTNVIYGCNNPFDSPLLQCPDISTSTTDSQSEDSEITTSIPDTETEKKEPNGAPSSKSSLIVTVIVAYYGIKFLFEIYSKWTDFSNHQQPAQKKIEQNEDDPMNADMKHQANGNVSNVTQTEPVMRQKQHDLAVQHELSENQLTEDTENDTEIMKNKDSITLWINPQILIDPPPPKSSHIATISQQMQIKLAKRKVICEEFIANYFDYKNHAG